MTVLDHPVKIHGHQGRWTLMPHGTNGVLSVVAYIYKMGQIEILLKKPLAPSSRGGRLATVCSGAGLLAGKGRGSTHRSLPTQSKQQLPSPQLQREPASLSYRC